MYFGTLYIQAQNHALNAFTDLTRTEIIVVQQLCLINKPVHYYALYSCICSDYGTISRTAYQNALDKLVLNGDITRKSISNNTIYGITEAGKLLFIKYNSILDLIVKDKVLQYGNGL